MDITKLPIGHPFRLNWLYERYLGKDLSKYTAEYRAKLKEKEKEPKLEIRYIRDGGVDKDGNKTSAPYISSRMPLESPRKPAGEFK